MKNFGVHAFPRFVLSDVGFSLGPDGNGAIIRPIRAWMIQDVDTRLDKGTRASPVARTRCGNGPMTKVLASTLYVEGELWRGEKESEGDKTARG